MQRFFSLVLAVLVFAACGAVQERAGDFDLDFDLDLDAVLDEIRDCDRLVDRMVAAIQTAADAADELAASNEGLVSATRVRELVDQIAVSRWFELAETLGCLKLDMELRVLDQMRDLAPESDAGRELLEQIERELGA